MSSLETLQFLQEPTWIFFFFFSAWAVLFCMHTFVSLDLRVSRVWNGWMWIFYCFHSVALNGVSVSFSPVITPLSLVWVVTSCQRWRAAFNYKLDIVNPTHDHKWNHSQWVKGTYRGTLEINFRVSLGKGKKKKNPHTLKAEMNYLQKDYT